MQIEFLPLLETQRSLLDHPRGFERFRKYLETMIGADGEPVLPLMAFNPMAKSHVAAVLDNLIEVGAETAAREAAATGGARLAAEPGAYKLGLVLADDSHGGWTNRYCAEASHHFQPHGENNLGFITVLLWTSSVVDPDLVRHETLMAIYRRAWINRCGEPKTLGAMLDLLGWAHTFAAGSIPLPCGISIPAEQILMQHLDSDHYPTIMACLYGDAAATSLGYATLGLPDCAGFRYAATAEKYSDDPLIALSGHAPSTHEVH
ncbi:MAG TPA: hypothetical protein VNX22_09965 [Acidobacteriaceae bacterium]|nr:hypothetical protein [Acidobacteriaceae bacterium]